MAAMFFWFLPACQPLLSWDLVFRPDVTSPDELAVPWLTILFQDLAPSPCFLVNSHSSFKTPFLFHFL